MAGGGPLHRAQEKQQQKSETLVRIETELVQIDVVVQDGKGNLVRDLKREDFQLLEDGKPQTVSYFSIGTATQQAKWLGTKATTPTKSAGGAVTVEAANDGRYFVLAVDDLHLSPGNLLIAKRALQQFIDRQMSNHDRTALITTSGTLSQFQQFTSEREVLRRAINRLSVQERTATNVFDVPRISPYQAELIDMNDPDALELAVQEIIAVMRVERRQAVGMAQARARQIIAQNTSVSVATLATLENVIRDLKALPGRKIMVLVSDGFLLGGMREGRQYDVRRITDAATKAGVVIYSIDARGLVATPLEMDASAPGGFSQILPGVRSRIAYGSIDAQRDGLYALAADTGGKAIFNNNDLNLGLQRVLDDTEVYYLLAFEPSVSYRDGRYRKLEIKLPNHPDYKVRTRKGYFAPDEKQLAKEEREKAKLLEESKTSEKGALKLRDLQVRTGLSSLVPLRDIQLGLAASFLDTRDQGSTVDLAAHIDINGLQLTQSGDRHRGQIELITIIYDENGKDVESRSEKMELNLRQQSLERARRYGLGYRRLLQLKPGFYQIRMVLRQEGASQIGTATAWVEAPDLSKKQLALSGIFLTQDRQSPTQTETGITEENEDSGARSLVYRRFRRDSQFEFLVFTYNARIGDKGMPDVAIQSQIYNGNKLVFASPLSSVFTAEQKQTLDPARIPYYARLALDSFEPGQYELRLVVIDRTTKTTAKRSINFIVE